MLEGVAHAIVDLVKQYGYIVIFVFMFLETSMVFPLVPSEIVVPSTAYILVHGPVDLVVFVLAATAGATVGSLFAYYVFGETSHFVLERYGEYVRVSDAEVDRAQRWFHYWGESSVFWGRLLPILRSIISIPAGFAEMAVGKFAVYSATGSGIFTAAVAVLVYYLDTSEGPLQFIIARTWKILLTYPVVIVSVCVGIVILGLIAWKKYGRQLTSYVMADI